MIDVFIKYLNLNLLLNNNILDKLFNDITLGKDTKLDKFSVQIRTDNYPYLNFTTDNYVNLIAPVEIVFTNANQTTRVARIDA